MFYVLRKVFAMDKTKKKRQIQYTNAKETAQKQQSGFSPSSLNLPKGVSSFYFKKEGLYSLDVMPFIAGKGNPMADEGFVHWERTYWAHRGVGAENKTYCCLEKNWGEKCPICEHRREQEKKSASEDYVKSLYPKKRQIMAMIDLQDKGKGVQVYEGAYAFGLGQLIDNKIDAAREGSKIGHFFHLEDGMMLSVKIKSEAFKTSDGGGGKFLKPVNLEMEPREENYSEDKLDSVPCLDELLDKPKYEKLHDIFHKGTDAAESEEDNEDDTNSKASSKSESAASNKGKSSTPPAAKTAPVVKEEEDEEEEEAEFPFKLGDKVTHATHGVCSVLAIADGKMKLQDKTNSIHRAIKPSEVSLYVEKEEPKSEIQNIGRKKNVKKDEEE
jgi:hypothetical protein